MMWDRSPPSLFCRGKDSLFYVFSKRKASKKSSSFSPIWKRGDGKIYRVPSFSNEREEFPYRDWKTYGPAS